LDGENGTAIPTIEFNDFHETVFSYNFLPLLDTTFTLNWKLNLTDSEERKEKEKRKVCSICYLKNLFFGRRFLESVSF
jgi:hypothetical protein